MYLYLYLHLYLYLYLHLPRHLPTAATARSSLVRLVPTPSVDLAVALAQCGSGGPGGNTRATAIQILLL